VYCAIRALLVENLCWVGLAFKEVPRPQRPRRAVQSQAPAVPPRGGRGYCFFCLAPDRGRNAPKAPPRVPCYPKPQESRHKAPKLPKTARFSKTLCVPGATFGKCWKSAVFGHLWALRPSGGPPGVGGVARPCGPPLPPQPPPPPPPLRRRRRLGPLISLAIRSFCVRFGTHAAPLPSSRGGASGRLGPARFARSSLHPTRPRPTDQQCEEHSGVSKCRERDVYY